VPWRQGGFPKIGRTYGGKSVVDLEGSYPVRDDLTLALGGQSSRRFLRNATFVPDLP